MWIPAGPWRVEMERDQRSHGDLEAIREVVVRGWFDRLLLWMSTTKRVDGLLLVAPAGVEARPVICRVEAALLLIKLYDRARYNRLVRDLERLDILVQEYSACYVHSIKACRLDTRYVLAEDTSLEEIASSIVHEATHARLCRLGIGYDETLRARVEMVCVHRQIAFARRLPDGERLRENAEYALRWCSDSRNLTDEGFDERRMQGAAEALRSLGCPNWLVRLIVAVPALRRSSRRVRHRLMGCDRDAG
jgi:hypothetical protein